MSAMVLHEVDVGRVVSQPGCGSTFRFTLHLEKPIGAALPSGATQAA